MTSTWDDFMIAVHIGGPYLLGAVVVAIIAAYVGGLVQMDRSTRPTYTRAPDADTQLQRAGIAKARTRATEARMRNEAAS